MAVEKSNEQIRFTLRFEHTGTSDDNFYLARVQCPQTRYSDRRPSSASSGDPNFGLRILCILQPALVIYLKERLRKENY